MTTSASPVSTKDAEAFRTIGEVAEALKVPQHVLRFWETRFAQIKPMKRAGNRRFYRPQDVELVGAIRQLLYGEGYTIKGVQRILREQGPRAVAALARQGGPPALSTGAHEGADDEPSEGDVAAGLTELDLVTLLRAARAELDDCRRILSEAGAGNGS